MNAVENIVTDEELAEQAVAGDQRAFRILYERYFGRLCDFLARMTRDPDEAADIAQDTFMKLLPGASSRPPLVNFRAWLYTVARNAATDKLRRQRRQVPLPDEGADTEKFSLLGEIQTTEGPEEAVINQELADLVWQAAQGLKPDDYALLDLSLRQQLEPWEVAQVLGIKPGNVYTKMNRLKDRLEKAVTSLILIRGNRKECPNLDQVVASSVRVEHLSSRAIDAVSRHVAACDTCSRNRRRYASAAAMFGSLTPVLPALAVQEEILSSLLNGFATGGASGVAMSAQSVTSSSAAAAAASSAAPAVGVAGTVVKGILAATVVGVIALGALMGVGVIDPPGPLKSLAMSLGIIDGPDDYYRAGLAHKYKLQWKEATDSFTKTVELDHRRFDALAERGLAHRVLGQSNEAIADFQGTILKGKSPSSLMDHYYVGFAHLQLAELGQGAHHLELALAAFDSAVAANVKNADVYVNRGIAQRHLAAIRSDNSGLRRAIEDFDRAIQLDPNYADAYANRGIALMYLGWFEESRQDFAKAVAIGGDPANPYLYDWDYWVRLIEAAVARIKQGTGR
jgi:RNA polymerase sigma-70 factor (ECF subfamily)